MRLLLALLVSLTLVACSSDDAKDGGGSSPEASGEVTLDDVVQGAVIEQAESRDGEIVVGVSDEVVYLRLSDATQAEARAEMDRGLEDASGLEAQIGEMVTGAVEGFLDTMLQIPHDDIDALIYQDGALYIEGGEGGSIQFGDNGDEGIPFEEADANRLIDAFERAR
ncbi:MAG: hypothetical protein AAFQ43_10780 [Bacteroidota bacterium]